MLGSWSLYLQQYRQLMPPGFWSVFACPSGWSISVCVLPITFWSVDCSDISGVSARYLRSDESTK